MTTIYSEDGLTVTRRYRDAPLWHWEATGEYTGRFVPADISSGYFPLVRTVRPEGTETIVYEYSVVRDGDVFRELWTPRPKDADELAEDAAEANSRSIRSEAEQALAGNRQYLQLSSPTTTQMRAQLESLTRQNNGLIRLVLGKLDGVD